MLMIFIYKNQSYYIILNHLHLNIRKSKELPTLLCLHPEKTTFICRRNKA